MLKTTMINFVIRETLYRINNRAMIDFDGFLSDLLIPLLAWDNFPS